jgi:hypothetical protein
MPKVAVDQVHTNPAFVAVEHLTMGMDELVQVLDREIDSQPFAVSLDRSLKRDHPCGTIRGGNTTITGEHPGFRDPDAHDYHVTRTSRCTQAAAELPREAAVVHAVTRQYVRHQETERRSATDRLDVGAFEGPVGK